MKIRLRKKRYRQFLEDAFLEMTCDEELQRHLIEAPDGAIVELQPPANSDLARAARAHDLRYVCRVVDRPPGDTRRETGWIRVQALEFPTVGEEAFCFTGSLFDEVSGNRDGTPGEPRQEEPPNRLEP